MKKNIGTIDQSIPIIVLIFIALLYFTNVISGTLAITLGGLAIVFVVILFIKFCSLYFPFNMSTIKTDKK